MYNQVTYLIGGFVTRRYTLYNDGTMASENGLLLKLSFDDSQKIFNMLKSPLFYHEATVTEWGPSCTQPMPVVQYKGRMYVNGYLPLAQVFNRLISKHQKMSDQLNMSSRRKIKYLK